eukprot:6880892-Ditylum_brightwellii.AAC.1
MEHIKVCSMSNNVVEEMVAESIPDHIVSDGNGIDDCLDEHNNKANDGLDEDSNKTNCGEL